MRVPFSGRKLLELHFCITKRSLSKNITAKRLRNLQVRNNYTRKWNTMWCKWHKSVPKFIQPSFTMKTEEADSAKRWYLSKNNNARHHIKEEQEFNSQRREKRELTVFASDTTQIMNFTLDTHSNSRNSCRCPHGREEKKKEKTQQQHCTADNAYT